MDFNIGEDPYLSFLQQNSSQELYQSSNSLLNKLANNQNIDDENPSVKLEEEMEKQQLSNSFKKKNSKKKKKKDVTPTKKKVFYRDRMIQLTDNDDRYKHEEYNYGEYAGHDKDKTRITRQQQLKRNRESARQSRERKKQYVVILEHKNKENNKKVKDLEKRVKQLEGENERLRQTNTIYIRNFITRKNDTYEKLSDTLKKIENQEMPDEHQLEVIFADFFKKYATAGEERIAVMKYHLNEIFENLMSDVGKYFMMSAINNSGLIGESQTKMDKELALLLDLDQKKKKYLTIKYIDQFRKDVTDFKCMMQKLNLQYFSIENQSRVIQNYFQGLRKELSVEKLAKCALWFQENKFTKDVKNLRANWLSMLTTQEIEHDHLIKKTKL